jgi:hypothetical protein
MKRGDLDISPFFVMFVETIGFMKDLVIFLWVLVMALLTTRALTKSK